SRLRVLIAFSLLLLDGQAQVLLQQDQPSITRKRSKTANFECKVEGIDNFQAAYIHWYRHIPTRAPERLLYIASSAQITYEEESYKNKYYSSKRDKNICTFSVNNVHEDDEGTYYCAYW
ncbi:TRGV3 protein, partial [Anseranas semipalmata]|nr:TRGV3 protein [Anseranas semipalmata]